MRGDRPWNWKEFKKGKRFTPHARGSTSTWLPWAMTVAVYPACAGIDQQNNTLNNTSPRLPRMRGDRPVPDLHIPQSTQFTPHARGSTLCYNNYARAHSVYPACAGIDLISTPVVLELKGLPRMRGDRPFLRFFVTKLLRFTPHARGSTVVIGQRRI